jgi:sulfatase modifying factor 1
VTEGCCNPGRREPRAPTADVSRIGPPGAASSAAPQPRLDFVDLPGGRFLMGTDDASGFPKDRECPVREVHVAPFSISRTAVSNHQFAAFIEATGYVTDAERFGWSFVFDMFIPPAIQQVSPRPDAAPWWCAVRGATWANPEGPGSHALERPDHPAVHISWNDASAFATWAGCRLPLEAEWEYAARGGLEQARYPWGDDLNPGGRYMCNIWRGDFPGRATGEDGYVGTAPVDAFPPNGYGLFNMTGNVWEWCEERWDAHSEERVMRGGSYLCHSSYCNRYRVAARSRTDPSSGSGNNGLRLVRAD